MRGLLAALLVPVALAGTCADSTTTLSCTTL